jgi:hypothetical protein
VNTAALFAAVFAALYAGHMVGDHVAQTDWQAAHKADKGLRGALAMAGHLAGYGACQALALAALQLAGVALPDVAGWVGLVVSVATHGLIDRRWPVRWLLCHSGSRDFAGLAGRGLNGMYLADQSLHVGCLFLAALIATGVAR